MPLRILFIIAALIIAGIMLGFLISGGKEDMPDIPDAPPGFDRNGNSVTIPDEMTLCEEGEYCIVVDTHCGFCCDFQTINGTQETRFDKGFTSSCKNYSGEMCQCYDLSSYPACVKGKCEMVKWPQ